MNKLHLPLIEALPEILVTPERFGGVAVEREVVVLPIPENVELGQE